MQVVHSYGEKPNEDFLQYYGFVDIENVNDAYTANLMQWVKQHFHAETGRVQAVEKSKAATKLLKQVASTLLTSLRSTYYHYLLDLRHLTLVCGIQGDDSLIIDRHALTHVENLDSYDRCAYISRWLAWAVCKLGQSSMPYLAFAFSQGDATTIAILPQNA